MTPTELPQRELDRRDLVSPQNVEASTQAIWERLEQPKRGPLLARSLVACAAAVLLVASGLRLLDADHTSPAATAVAARSVSLEQRSVSIAEGTFYRAEPGAELAPVVTHEGSVRVALRKGQVAWRVDRPQKAPLVVDLGAGWISGNKAAFRVTRIVSVAYEKHELIVEQGVVTVYDGVREQSVTAGERLSFTLPTAQPPEARRAARVEENSGKVEAERDANDRRARVDGASLFEAAAAAQRERDFARAAATYERLLREFPRDPRATLSAFELGRLRMDRLDDRRGAIQALEQAAAGASPFREEALARLVRVKDALGDVAACRSARRAYLERFPQGLYARTVSARCPPEKSSP